MQLSTFMVQEQVLPKWEGKDYFRLKAMLLTLNSPWHIFMICPFSPFNLFLKYCHDKTSLQYHTYELTWSTVCLTQQFMYNICVMWSRFFLSPLCFFFNWDRHVIILTYTRARAHTCTHMSWILIKGILYSWCVDMSSGLWINVLRESGVTNVFCQFVKL